MPVPPWSTPGAGQRHRLQHGRNVPAEGLDPACLGKRRERSATPTPIRGADGRGYVAGLGGSRAGG